MAGTLCFFNTTSIWGGGEKWHLEIALHLHKQGHPVILFVHPQGALKQRAAAAGLKTVSVRLANSSFLNPLKVNQVKRLFQKHQVQRVVLNLPRDMKCGGLAAKRAGVHDRIYRRGSAVPIRNDFINTFLFRRVLTRVLANSEATKATLLQNNPRLIPHEKITVIPNGIDTSLFEIGDFAPYYKRQNEEVVLCSLGRLERQKNHLFLIDVAVALRNRGIPFHLLIGGIGSLAGQISAAISKHGLEMQVELTGFIDRPRDFYLSGDVFVFPSLWEGFGYALAEASLCGKPIVAFANSSNSQVVQHKATGFLTAEGDVHAFTNAVSTLYQDPTKRNTMGHAGRNYVKQHFDYSNIFSRLTGYLLNKF